MFFNFENLDLLTRCLMLDEVNLDIITDCLYLPEYLNENGRSLFEILLKKAFCFGNESILADDLRKYNCVDLDKGKDSERLALEALAHAEFNRFYIRALCKRVINNRKGRLVIYSVLDSSDILGSSKTQIGKELEPYTTLSTLRKENRMMQYLHNGLSVRIV